MTNERKKKNQILKSTFCQGMYRFCTTIAKRFVISRENLAKSIMFSLNKAQKPTDGNAKQLLAAKVPLQIPARYTMANANAPVISMENPLADYKSLMDEMMNRNNEEAEETNEYKAIAAEARKVVWNLLFTEPSPENEKKAAELLKEHKLDACFYLPWDYNDWIVNVRDELLKREMFDFWHNVIVKQSLGLCCARDSDYFVDVDDPDPGQFYRHAGAVPPWETEGNGGEFVQEGDHFILPTGQPPVAKITKVPDADALKISLENPVNDYSRIVDQYLTQDSIVDDDVLEATYKAIAENAQKTVWSLLFDNPQPPSEERQKSAGDLLCKYKSDAVFYSPHTYNEWIVKVRDEVLNRSFLEFWRNHMVDRALGLCWAGDSDFYDDIEDTKPSEFYEHAGCVAPWLKENAQNEANESKSTA